MSGFNRNGQPYKIGVMGSASGPFDPEHVALARRLGHAIGKSAMVMITGACPGLPLEAAAACKEEGGLVIGVSPALSMEEHVTKYNSPTEHHHVIIYTGTGLMGREVINIRSCDMIVFVGGKSGTLGEFSIAYDEGRLMGVIRHSGGISDHIEEIIKFVDKDTGAVVLYDTQPERLVESLIVRFKQMEAGGITHQSRFDGQPRPNGNSSSDIDSSS